MHNQNDQPILVTLPQPALTRPSGTGLTERAEWAGLDLNYHPQVRQAAIKIVDWYNRGCGALLLAGNTGCGKTHMAREVFKRYGGPGMMTEWTQGEFGNWEIRQFRNAVLYSEPEMMAAIRQSYGNQEGRGKTRTEATIVGDCQQANLFILDDLGVAHIKEESLPWAHDIYWRLFDTRVDRFTLITTNLTISEWQTRIGRRAFSRLMQALGGETAIVDLFDVPDYRLRGWAK